MGLFQAKHRAISAAIAAAALIASPALASTVNTTRAPASKADLQPRASESSPGLGQADAFASAGEQAVFLGAYQMYFGPYGKLQNQEEREKALRETAQAINDCINSRDCGKKKQEQVLKALVQYNLGQDIKRAMLTMNTNKENMRSIDNSTDGEAASKKQGVLNQDQITKALQTGKEFSVDNADPVKPLLSGKEAQINRTSGSMKDPYFQLKEETVRHGIDERFVSEREILGDAFLKEYDAFLQKAGTDTDESYYYQYVPAKQSDHTYVYDPNRSVSMNQQRMADAQSNLRDLKMKEIVADYRKGLTPLKGSRKGDAVEYEEGSLPSEIGVGEMVDIDPAKYPHINFNDLMVDGRIPAANHSRAVARIVNRMFEETAKKSEEKDPKAKGNARTIASEEDSARITHNIMLSPEKFDEFLDEIWPSAATRQRRLSSAPPAEATVGEPATEGAEAEAAEEEPTRDRWGRRIHRRPQTDNRPPRE